MATRALDILCALGGLALFLGAAFGLVCLAVVIIYPVVQEGR